MIQNQLLNLSDNVYKVKGKDATENALPEMSETETPVIYKTQKNNEKTLGNVQSFERDYFIKEDL